MTRSQWDDLRAPHPTDRELADTLQAAAGVRRRRVERAEQRARAALAVNYSHAGADLLDLPEAQPVIARIGEACAFVSDDIDRVTYVRGIVLDVLAAKARPRCPQGDRA